MPKIIRKFSEVEVRNAKHKEKPYKLYDEGGLRLLVRPSGAKVWQYPYVLRGKSNTYTLGPYDPSRKGFLGILKRTSMPSKYLNSLRKKLRMPF